MDVIGGGEQQWGDVRRALAIALVLVSLIYSGGVMMHRAYAVDRGGVGAADKAMGEVRGGPRLSWAAKAQPRTAMRPLQAGPPADDDDPYVAAVEGIGVEFGADLQHIIASTRQAAIATLRDLYGERHDLEASVDYMIGVALGDAAATTLRT